VDAVLESGLNSIGVYGISFKKGCDDLRGSSALAFVRELVRRGLEVHIFDPTVNASLASFGLAAIEKDIADRMSPEMDEWLLAIQGVVVTQKLDSVTMGRIEEAGLPVIDLSRGTKLKRSSVGAAV
jgi:UDP-glucose 6-dehydrogenase